MTHIEQNNSQGLGMTRMSREKPKSAGASPRAGAKLDYYLAENRRDTPVVRLRKLCRRQKRARVGLPDTTQTDSRRSPRSAKKQIERSGID